MGPLLAISFGEFLWSLLIIFFAVMFFVILFHVVVDVFRSDDLSGGAKALWLILIIILPFIGLLIYLVARGDNMARRQAQDAADYQASVDAYIRQTAGGSAAQIAKAKELLDAGTISEEEFQKIKSQALA
ncbi:MAG: SHOCT domain-containing protein [Thermoleophilia bacterium]|nr:SHOCT domain-containing protein [Thermoleophilia bacterium]MDH3725667.1 SHOCT domain-containing protein [Thermoleophilia bacterium]